MLAIITLKKVNNILLSFIIAFEVLPSWSIVIGAVKNGYIHISTGPKGMTNPNTPRKHPITPQAIEILWFFIIVERVNCNTTTGKYPINGNIHCFKIRL